MLGQRNFWQSRPGAGGAISIISEKSVTSRSPNPSIPFGSADALCQDMMPQLTETLGHSYGPSCTREQAQELLEGLRAAYRSISLPNRSLVKTMIGQAARAQLMQELE